MAPHSSALALLRLDSVGAYCATCTGRDPAGREDNIADLDRIQTSVRHALQEIHAISSGLRLPQLNTLTLAEAVARAIRMHERRTGTTVVLECAGLPDDIPLPVKITVYRVIEEALNNAYRHGGGIDQQVTLVAAALALRLEIADHGPGFDGIPITDSDQHLGLVGMRERIESLGGEFDIASERGKGTAVIVQIPLQVSGGHHERANPDGDRGRSPASARGRRIHTPR
jgi:signal transduction histidine kinase